MISAELINECISGREESIQVLVRTYQRGVFQLALSILDFPGADQAQAASQAEIVTRETFVAALERLGRYREDTPFEAWLYRITVQVSLRRAAAWERERWLGSLFQRLEQIVTPWRRPDAANKAAQPQPEGDIPPAAALERSRRDEALWRAVGALKMNLRLPVILRYYHDFSVEQIAALLNTSEGAIHARLDLARERIAARVETAN